MASGRAVTVAAVLLCTTVARAQNSAAVLDLTSPQTADQRGLGIPAGSGGGGFSGQRMSHYELPLRIEIARASVNHAGDVIVEVMMENVGKKAVELPISREISDVQRAPGQFRRELFWGVRASGVAANESLIVAVTGGSRVVPTSLVRLEPQQSIRALLRIPSNWVKESRPKNEKTIRVQVTCGEWTLQDDRFSVESTAREITSENMAVVGYSDGSPIATVSEP